MNTINDWIFKNKMNKKQRIPPAKKDYNIHPDSVLAELHTNAVVAANYGQPSTRYFPGTGYKM